MDVEKGRLTFYFWNPYPAYGVSNALWYGISSGMTSTTSLYDPHAHFSYVSPARNALSADSQRIASDFRSVVSSGSFLIPSGVRTTTTKSG